MLRVMIAGFLIALTAAAACSGSSADTAEKKETCLAKLIVARNVIQKEADNEYENRTVEMRTFDGQEYEWVHQTERSSELHSQLSLLSSAYDYFYDDERDLIHTLMIMDLGAEIDQSDSLARVRASIEASEEKKSPEELVEQVRACLPTWQ